MSALIAEMPTSRDIFFTQLVESILKHVLDARSLSDESVDGVLHSPEMHIASLQNHLREIR